MERVLNGVERRKHIVEIMRSSEKPISGTALGKATGVSRQVIVQDMALLRTEGYPVLSTARGYMLDEPKACTRLLKLCHTNEQTEDELNTVVDLGGCILDVMVNHRIYGEVCASLNIKNRRDVQKFMEDLQSGKSVPLMNVTLGYHFHHILAESEEVLCEIEEALKKKGYLAEFTPYERDCINK